MKQLISRIIANKNTVELLTSEGNKEYFKEFELKEYLEIIKCFCSSFETFSNKKSDVILFDNNFIGVGQFCKIIKQDEHKRIVTYKNKSYKISFPNAIYFVYHDDIKINGIDAYCYIDFKGAKTKLYKYPFPNMLTGNRICLGSAPKELTDRNYIEALENIIFTQYTHANVDNIKSFKDTDLYFTYLEKNEFPYDLLIPIKNTLQGVIKSYD